MPSQLTLLLGDAGSGKTGRLLAEYREALRLARQRRCPGTVLWLAPTHRAQQAIVGELLDASEPVLFAPRVLTFDVFAEQILVAAGRRATLMSSVVKRLLLRRIVGELSRRGQLDNFASVTETTGFLDVVSSFISELKREEIWPETFLEAVSHGPANRAARDRELGLIYSKYQEHLTRQDWYDSEGRFWLARTALNDGVRGPFAAVELLVVDGFADFTQTQHEILGGLMEWIPRTIISLPYDAMPPSAASQTADHNGHDGRDRHDGPPETAPLFRPGLFDKPVSTIGRIRKNLPPGTAFRTERLVADRSGWPAGMRVVAQSLFANPRSITKSEDGAGLELIAATGPLGEAQSVALRIKTLLNTGTPPGRIVVAVRSVTETGPVWREHLEQAGIPVWCEAGAPLTSSPMIKALFSVLQLELEDWPFQRLIQVLGSNYFDPDGANATTSGRGARIVAAALRRLKLHAGREMILRVLGRVAGGASFEEETDAEFDGDTRAAVAALARTAETILKRLSHATDRLRKRRTLSEWGDVLAPLLQDLGWRRSSATEIDPAQRGVRSPDEAGRNAQDRRDWELLQRIIRTAGEADERLSSSVETKSSAVKKTAKAKTVETTSTTSPPSLDLAGFTAELRDLLGGEQIKAAPDPGGCVRILDVEQVRHLNVPHLFVCGLAESSFPLNRADDCLFGEMDRRDFALRGVPLQHREQHQQDEMFLFHSVVTRARSRLTLSYPAVNSKGQPVFPSPYVLALRSLFTDSALAVASEGELNPVPKAGRAMTESDLRLLSISDARSGNSGLFARLCGRSGWLETGRNIVAAVEVNAQRFHERGFTCYEGRLSSGPNLEAMRQRFGTRHQFSATELEDYAACPYRFWVGRVLGVEDLPTPEEGTDHAARGSLVHVVLAQMLREGLDHPAEEIAARFRLLVEEHLGRRFHETELQRALTRIEQRLLSQWGDAFSRQQAEYARQLQEAWTGGVASLPPEIPFGSLPNAADAGDLESVQTGPLAFGHGDGSALVRGRIDRVDTGFAAGRRVFNVIDYKTGSPPRSNEAGLKTGRSIQLALYALAVRRLEIAGPDAGPFQMGYWSLKATGFKRGYQRDSKTLVAMEQGLIDSLEQILDETIPQLAAGIRDGKFLVENSDENCTGHCAYHTTCRVNQIRPLAQKLNKIGDILKSSDGAEAGANP
jgi:ATP-dependent helicase/DNAse subunit B